MKHALILLFALAPVFAFADVKAEIAAVEKTTQSCLDNPANYSTYGMNTCIGQGYESADKIMNRVYNSLVSSLKKSNGDVDSDKSNQEILRRLVKAQRAWVTFRDANSDLRGTQMLGGSGESQVYLGSQLDMTKARTLELIDIL